MADYQKKAPVTSYTCSFKPQVKNESNNFEKSFHTDCCDVLN